MRKRTSRLAVLAGSGVTGVVLAHAADYVIAVPDRHERDHVLAATGHGYWPAAVVLAAIAGLATVAVAVASGAKAAVTARGGHRGWRPSWLGLAAWQKALFLGVEVVERAVAGVSPLDLVQGPELAIGLALQVVVAGAIVAVLAVLYRTARAAVGHLRARRRRRSTTAGTTRTAERVAGAVVAGLPAPRGPPAALAG